MLFVAVGRSVSVFAVFLFYVVCALGLLFLDVLGNCCRVFLLMLIVMLVVKFLVMSGLLL